MFLELTNFALKRTPKQALGFYFAYLLFIIILSGLIGGLFGYFSKSVTYEIGARLGTLISVVTSLYLSFLMLQKKKLTKNTRFLLLAILSGFLAYIGGGLLGLIPASYLSTK